MRRDIVIIGLLLLHGLYGLPLEASSGVSRSEGVSSGRSSRGYSRWESPFRGWVFTMVGEEDYASLGLRELHASGKGLRERVWLKGTQRGQEPRYVEGEALGREASYLRAPMGCTAPKAEDVTFEDWLRAVKQYMSAATVDVSQAYRASDDGGEETLWVRQGTHPLGTPREVSVDVSEALDHTLVSIDTILPDLSFTYRLDHTKVYEGSAGTWAHHVAMEGDKLGQPSFRHVTYGRPAVISGDYEDGVWSSLAPLTKPQAWHQVERTLEPFPAVAFDLTLLHEGGEEPTAEVFPQSLFLMTHVTTHGRGYVYVDQTHRKVYVTQTTQAQLSAPYGEGSPAYRLCYTQPIALSLTLDGIEGIPEGLYEVYGGEALSLVAVDKTHQVDRSIPPYEVGPLHTITLEAGLSAAQARDGLQGMREWWSDIADGDKVPLRQEKALLDVFPEVGLRDVLPLRLGYFPRKPAIPLPSSLWELTLTGFTLDDTLAAQIGAMGGLTQLTLDKMTGSDSAFARALGSDALCHVNLSGSEGIGPLTRGRVAALHGRLRAEGGGTFTPHNGDEWVLLCDGAVGLTPAVKEWLLSHGDKEATTGPGAKRRGDLEARGGRWVKALERYEFAFRKGMEGTVGSLIADILWEGKTGVTAQKGRAVDLYERYGTASQKIEAAYALMEGEGLTVDHRRSETLLMGLQGRGAMPVETSYALTALYTLMGDEAKASHYMKQALLREAAQSSLIEGL